MKLGVLLGGILACLSAAEAAKQPNILFILTDDQGKYIGGLEHMPKLQQTLIQKGTTYTKHYCSIALCCPSRANLWTGRMPHNTNITDVGLPYGGYPKIVSAGWNDNYLPLWMQDAGYDTYYVGKLWNSHTEQNYNDPYARGFNGSEFLLDPWTYRYYHARMTRNGEPPVRYDGEYSTDVIREKALGFLDDALRQKEGDGQGRPFMLTVAPNAPHSNGSHDPGRGTTWFGEPEYAPRHAGLFKDYKIPRDDSFNKVIQGAVGWTAQLSELSQKEVDYIDEFQRCRLRALQAVDELIAELVEKLERKGELENTYIFFSTDNGYHIGQHAMQPGKNCGYETDINVPLIVRGPGIPENATLDAVTSHTDLAPTFLSIAGASRPGLDGKRIPTTVDAGKADNRTEHVAIEYWGRAIPEGIYGHYSDKGEQPGNGYRNNTYKAVRLVSEEYSVYYAVWCTNEQEFYDLKNDPHQTTNLASSNTNTSSNSTAPSIASRPLPQILARLDALMLVLKSCSEDSCRYPWRHLHPAGKVNSLADALDKGFDGFYANQPKVAFSECNLGYHTWAEGPQEFNVFGQGGGASEKRWWGGFGGGWF
ncbi:Arylsulphatase [Aspergillus steynii IBT 23096]|uniref:Arylsulfatase n=1 Tax=Aspergillus steynii IBT 23096 TaxID=1392250 RepID=A0A2I2FRR4_9EURO|nr:Arylsulphatase [Aspergillus steynii IBT 23096]PLB43296.1 Arylsulphatase [Aspergillus steynii IBT 23096]